jgi:hypothetical protein
VSVAMGNDGNGGLPDRLPHVVPGARAARQGPGETVTTPAAVDRRLPPRGDGTTQRACRGLSRTGPDARSSVSLFDALLPGDILATSGLTRNTRTRLALGHVV